MVMIAWDLVRCPKYDEIVVDSAKGRLLIGRTLLISTSFEGRAPESPTFSKRHKLVKDATGSCRRSSRRDSPLGLLLIATQAGQANDQHPIGSMGLYYGPSNSSLVR